MPASPKATTRFRALMDSDRLTILPAVGDPFAARMVAAEGFAALMASGNAMSAMRLGLPDVGLLTLTENAEAAGRIAHASGLPVLADADTGYGNALNVRRTVMELERAGVAAVMIEDQVTPKRCGMLAGKQVIPHAEMEMKVKAALDARRDDDLVIVARTDARAVEGLDGAIRRAEIYAKAGADAIFVEGPRSIEEAEAIGRGIDKPLIYNVTPTGSVPSVETKVLERLGYRFLSFSVYLVLAAIPGMRSILRQVKTGDVASAARGAASIDDYLDLLGLEGWQRAEEAFAAAAGTVPERSD